MARCEISTGPSKPGVVGSIPAGHAAFPSEIEGDAGSTEVVSGHRSPHCVPTAGTPKQNARSAPSLSGYLRALARLSAVVAASLEEGLLTDAEAHELAEVYAARAA